MVASLPMYRRPELEGEHRRFWALIREQLAAEGIDSPETLSQDADELSVWEHPDLVLSQTCGLPYRRRLVDKVSLVGTPDYGVEGCPPGFYRSAIVVRTDETRQQLATFRDAVFAYNQEDSQSGYAAPYWHLAPLGFWFENRLQRGTHLDAARAVAEGRADLASIDAVSWRFMTRYDDFASGLRVLEWTTPTPGLPLISAKGADVGAIFRAVERAISRLGADDRGQLGLEGIVAIPRRHYLALADPT